MTTNEILETTKSWASQRFTPEAGQLEVSEKLTPPPFVDVPSDSTDRSGVFLDLKHVDGAELQVWIPASGAGSAYCMLDGDDGEVDTSPLPAFGSASELQGVLARLSDRFFLTRVFERALEMAFHNAEHGGRFIEPCEFMGDAAYTDVNPRDWLFGEFPIGPDPKSPVTVVGIHGSGAVATFYEPNHDDLGGFLDFDEEGSGLLNAEQLNAWVQTRV